MTNRLNQKIGMFYGSDTGFTEAVAEKITRLLGSENVDVYNISDTDREMISGYRFLIFGLSTWHDGQLQYDWDNFYEEFQEIDFTNKAVALFGLGDQAGYPHYFIDGVGMLGEVVYKNGGDIVGVWPTEGYYFDSSKAVFQEGWFLGLAIDEDNQANLMDERIEVWVDQIKGEFQEYSDTKILT